MFAGFESDSVLVKVYTRGQSATATSLFQLFVQYFLPCFYGVPLCRLSALHHPLSSVSTVKINFCARDGTDFNLECMRKSVLVSIYGTRHSS